MPKTQAISIGAWDTVKPLDMNYYVEPNPQAQSVHYTTHPRDPFGHIIRDVEESKYFMSYYILTIGHK